MSLNKTIACLGLVALTLSACADSEQKETADDAINNATNNENNEPVNNGDYVLSVTAVAPNVGPAAGGTVVVISGAGFLDGATVNFGENAATDVTLISPFQLRAATPAGAPGATSVSVRNPDGLSAMVADAFEYIAPVEAGIDWCTIQFPAVLEAEPGATTAPVFGRVYEDGCTNGGAQCQGIQGELGFGAPGADPSTSPEAFTWTAAAYNPDHAEDDNDEYSATLTVADAGTYAYAYRFSLDGQQWTYCDLDGADNGFQTDQMGTLTVAENVVAVSWCAIQFPATLEAEPGAATAPVFGRVFAEGCTNGDAQCQEIVGQLGVGPQQVDPSSSPTAFTWTAAAYNPSHSEDDNDEYSATLTVADEGTYAYAYRFSVDGENWLYCDLDGADNGFQTEQTGTLTVAEDVVAVSWCTIQFPSALRAEPGETSAPVFGRVFAEGCTNGDAQCQEIQGELGYGAPGADPSDSPDDFTWTAATYNPDHAEDDNDEYTATMTIADEGTYAYAYRFSVDGESWLYCDLDSADNGFQADQMGTFTVTQEVEAPEIGWCQVQFPSSLDTAPGVVTESVFGQVFVEGCTGDGVRCPEVTAQLGFGPAAADPSIDAEAFTWEGAFYNEAHGGDDNDEYSATMTPIGAGDFRYAYRFSTNGGESWTVCDTNGDDGFQPEQMGTLTVATQTIGFCAIQFPDATEANINAPTPDIYGRVYVAGCSDGDRRCGGILAELGYGDPEVNPADNPDDYTWTQASYNPSHVSNNDDEYQASLTVSALGTFAYAYRFSGDGGVTWVVCDNDGNDLENNGVTLDQLGTLTINAE